MATDKLVKVELSQRQKRIIATADRYITELEDDMWQIVGQVMVKQVREEESHFGAFSMGTEEVNLAMDFAHSKTDFESAAKGSQERYECALEFLGYWNAAISVGGIIQGEGRGRKIKELEAGIKNLDSTITTIRETTFSKCPQCGYEKGWKDSLV